MKLRVLRIAVFTTAMAVCGVFAPGRLSGSGGGGGQQKVYRLCGGLAGMNNASCKACKNIVVDGVFIWSRGNSPSTTYRVCEEVTSQQPPCADAFSVTCYGVFYALPDCAGDPNNGAPTNWTESTCLGGI